MATNKMKRSVASTNPLAKDINLPGDSGVFAANPAPGFREYPETPGKVLPARKFQDTDSAEGLLSKGMKDNQLRRSVKTPNIAEEMGLQKPGTSKILTGRNRYETQVKSSNTGKDKI